MSNYLAIAAVTSTLKNLLQEKAATVLGGCNVAIGRPKEGTPKGITIFLYQVNYNPEHRNDDLPTRRAADTTLSQRPRAALDLYYLLTFYGSEQILEPQILLGSTIGVLHAQPVITREMLREEIKRHSDPDELAKYKVSDQVRGVTFTPLSFNTEEVSKLWSMLFKIPYTLSVAYKASVVFVEAEVTPREALPVRRREAYVLPFRRPVIEGIGLANGDMAPIVRDSKIVITGHQLKGDLTRVSIGEVTVPIDTADTENTVTDSRIILSLGSAAFADKPLRAGIQGVHVLHPVLMGDSVEERYGFESNVKPLVLSPTITEKTPEGTDLKIRVEPEVGKTQRVLALLNELGANIAVPHAYSIKAPDNNGITGDKTETSWISFSVADVEPGDYLLRIQVDGAESPLEAEPDPTDPEKVKYAKPMVTIS
ncbi:MAG: DUF4255 domain-containing protein [Actinomycetota bacterium]|nr:DUF4255 domain-containing protein [Actinomycetota bacterium]